MTTARWRVFTVTADGPAPQSPDDHADWLVGSTLWTERGPQHDTYITVASLTGVSQATAECAAAVAQRAYDKVRRNIMEPV